jgi:hypothetical protein
MGTKLGKQLPRKQAGRMASALARDTERPKDSAPRGQWQDSPNLVCILLVSAEAKVRMSYASRKSR